MFNHLLGRVLISSVNHHFSSKQEARKEFVELHRLYGFTIGPMVYLSCFVTSPRYIVLISTQAFRKYNFLENSRILNSLQLLRLWTDRW